MSFDRDIPRWRKWDLRLQGACLCLAAEMVAFLAWAVYQVLIGLAAIGRYG